MIVDLSHPLGPNMPAYPGLPVPQFHIFLSHQDDARQTNYAPGTTFQIATYDIGGENGADIHAPVHQYSHGAELAHVAPHPLAELSPGFGSPANQGGVVSLLFITPSL